VKYSVAMSGSIDEQARGHLLQHPHDEDLCFGLWYPSRGHIRQTAILAELILPTGITERRVHGNVEFLPAYFERALGLAIERNAGLAFMHSHLGPGWQNMSRPDIRAEQANAGAVLAATGRPFVGLTVGTDGAWSARFWERTAPKTYERRWCESVRVAGDALRVTFADHLRPPPALRIELTRTVSAWGERKQADLARLHVGVIGLGSVGSVVVEALARTGIQELTLIDFDSVERVNLDRVLHARRLDVLLGRAKVRVAANAASHSATAAEFLVHPIEASVCEEVGYRAALDCDVLFSCVDRPWPRSVLDFIAYAHEVPVIDAGILVSVTPRRTMRGADWKAHIVGPGRRCLECRRQYDPSLVAAERSGLLDDPHYIESLPEDHPARRNENVFAFGLSAASFALLQMLSMTIAPADYPDPGALAYHFVPGTLDRDHDTCRATCFTPRFLARGDSSPMVPTGRHDVALRARGRRRGLARLASTWGNLRSTT
jgi:ThiF family